MEYQQYIDLLNYFIKNEYEIDFAVSKEDKVVIYEKRAIFYSDFETLDLIIRRYVSLGGYNE